ncbi:MAG: Cytidine deaminase [Myxococcota bacterium]|nr:Cytidine deaminase [Myxococcota bacterium]
MSGKAITRARLKSLVLRAAAVRVHAYAPYSQYAVGAALLTDTGKVFTGVNVENASYGVTCCAERAALFAAVSQGHRRFRAIAIVTSSSPPARPCGICRQALIEFNPRMTVACASADDPDAFVTETMRELMPGQFGAGQLER